MKEAQILTKVKTELKKENLKASPQVKANLTQAFRAKHRPPIVVAINKGIPLWQVAASLLLLISAVWWLRPFESQTIVEAEPQIKIEEKIVTVIDTIVVEKQIEKIVEKPVIQYVEIPSTTKTKIQKRVEDEQPMAYDKPFDKTIFKPNVDLETLIDSYYDTAMVENIEGRVRGQSRENSGIPSFDVSVY
ncbi:MAG: hypothetical protein AB8G11_17670 [Saprospiraceae bacterium]